MKRGRGRPRNKPLQVVTPTKTAKRKGKRVVCKGKEVAEKTVEDQKPAGMEPLGPRELEEWGRLWSGVDEETTWGSCLCPYWEMEGMLMGMGVGEAYDAAFLYSDVLWDYDIWNLEAIGISNTPNP